MTRLHPRSTILPFVLVVGLIWTSAASANPFRDLQARAEAVVTVRFVLKVQMPGVDREVDNEVACLVIGADGLVLCSQTDLGGYIGIMARIVGRAEQPISSQPREVKVLLGDDRNGGLAARLVAQDRDRDLAWLLIDEPPENLPHVDLNEVADLSVGDRAYQLRRLDDYFGREPVVSEMVIGAVTDKPRRLLVPSRPLEGYLGSPVFTADGKLVGLTVVQVPSEGEGAPMMSSARTLPGQASKLDDMIGGVILPAADIVRATALAREMHAADEADAVE
ncbi:MAG: serine protease [Acidobacteriota bacterium]